MNQSKLKVITCSWREARENECKRVTIGSGFTSDWMKKWREFLKPIVSSNNAKPITFGHSKENRSNPRETYWVFVWWQFDSCGFPGRMGNNKQALQLIIQEENDVEKVSIRNKVSRSFI